MLFKQEEAVLYRMAPSCLLYQIDFLTDGYLKYIVALHMFRLSECPPGGDKGTDQLWEVKSFAKKFLVTKKGRREPSPPEEGGKRRENLSGS